MIIFFIKRIMLFFIILYVPISFSQTKNFSDVYLSSNSKAHDQFKRQDKKLAYALGISLGDYVNQSFEKQKKIGIKLDKSSLLEGIQDAILGTLKLSHEEISLTLKELEKQLNNATEIALKKNAKENLIKGKLYMKNFSKMKGVKKTSSGLLYFIEKEGEGKVLNENMKIVVHYNGTLINGVQFDSSYARGKPVSLILKDVILGWQEGLKYIKKGGKIKLVIPPHLGYGDKEVNGIPGNSTLVFDIELLDVVDAA